MSEQISLPTDDTPEWERIEQMQNYLANALRKHDGGRDLQAQKVVSELRSLLDQRPTANKSLVNIASGEIDYWSHVAKRKETVGTGLTSLDDMLGGGLESQRLMVLLGAPGGGKTTLANQMAVHAADSGRPVMYVTSEDVPFNLLAKTLARQGQIPYTAVLKGREAEKQQIIEALRTYRTSLAAQRLHYIDATLMIELEAVRDAAQAHFEQYKDAGQGILVIDYLQRLARGLASYRAGNGDLRLAVTYLTEQLRGIATALDCCVLALASQNRASGYGAGSNALSSGKESGDIEYTADIVLSIGDSEKREPATAFLVPKVLRLDKNRQGGTGLIELDWYPEQQQFTVVNQEDIHYVSSSNGRGKRGR